MITNMTTANSTINEICYHINYEKRDGTRRIIKARENVNFNMQNHVLVWDCENKGWRTLIKDKILNVFQCIRAIDYKKINNEKRILIGHRWKETDTHILIFDKMCDGWRMLIKDRIITDIDMLVTKH